MKKNGNKMVVIAIILAVMVLIGNILNHRSSAKEEIVEEPEGRTTRIVVWLTEKNGKDWDDGRDEIESIIQDEYESFDVELMHIHNEGTKIDWVELTYETELGTVTGRIIDHR